MTAPDNFMELADTFFNGECEVTKRKVKRVGFTIHHIKYIENDVERKMYQSTPNGTKKYYDDLYTLIEQEPERFALITNGIHNKLDSRTHGVCKLKLENRIRFCDLALRTIPKKQGRPFKI